MAKRAMDYFEERAIRDPEYAELVKQTEEIAKIAGKMVSLRCNAGLTIEQLAQKADVDIDVIKKFEDFDAMPSSIDLQKLANALNRKILIHYDVEISPNLSNV